VAATAKVVQKNSYEIGIKGEGGQAKEWRGSGKTGSRGETKKIGLVIKGKEENSKGESPNAHK